MNSKSNVKNFDYRPYIDGLRAIAVTLVLMYHAFPTLLPGGFIGVDIFFVISGYLISRIIFTSLTEDKFSVLNFYSRRILRIFPTLIVVIFTISIIGWFALIPEENTLLGKHTAAASLFFSNILLWNESGYFDIDSKNKPLLHLWSLSIEMQFYAIAPALFILFYKFKRQILLNIGLLIIFSFGLNLFLIQSNPVANFYFPITRMFELLAGSMLAYYKCEDLKTVINYNNTELIQKNYLSLLGLMLIIISVFWITPKDHFPGYVVIAPVIGAVLLIYSGPFERC